jgi:peptide/nickel transport system ATP-binding protein
MSDICTKAPPPLAEITHGHASRCIKAPLERLVS